MPQKKRVLHIIQSLDHGGCEVMLLRTLPLLSDFEHLVITLKQPGELAPKLTARGIRVECIRLSGFFDLPAILRLRRLVSETKPDIILTYLFHADMLGRLALIGTTTAPIIPFLRTTYNHSRYRIARVLEWLTRPLVKEYLANSEVVKKYYTKHIGVSPDAITVIPNGLDITQFESLQPDPKLRESLGIAPDDFVVTCIANLHPNKGLNYLLEAFEMVFTDFPQAKLLLIGAGEEHDRLREQIARYRSKGNVSFLGRRTDALEILRLSHCFVLPTLFEGMSTVLLEAMHSGLPIITTDIPENRILIKDGRTGVLVPPRSASAVAVAMRGIIEKPDSALFLSTNACAFAREHHSLAHSLSLLNNFLRTHTL